MSAGVVPWLLTAVLVPLAVAEFKDWWPWLAVRLVRWTARRLGDPHSCARYEEEWAANLQEVPGKLSPLLAAFGYLLVVPRMRWTLRRGPAPLNVRPDQLPSDSATFVGRVDALTQLDACLPARGCQGSSVARSTPVVVLTGMAGIGKTALVLRWANLRREKFTDGILYVHLRGHDPSAAGRMGPHEVLGQFLHSLGIQTAHIPATLEERVALYQTMMARRRLLVVLDEAIATSQVRQLIPDSPQSMVLITSRSRFTGLTPSDSTRHLTINQLDGDDAIKLMRTLVGADRADKESEAAKEVVRLCGHLPLALRLAGAHLHRRPQILLRQLVKDLQDAQDRLTTRDTDGGTTFRTAVDRSYRTLNSDVARLFRRLGALPSERLTLEDAVRLTESTVKDTRRLLFALVEAHLLDTSGSDLFRVHPLLRECAKGLLVDDEPDYRYPRPA